MFTLLCQYQEVRMIKTLKNWWNQEEAGSEEPELKLAVTKLMVGMMAMDGNVDGVEYSEVVRLLTENYNLSSEASKQLVSVETSSAKCAG